tara:strand:+ start:1976 stop:3376 length:1401 start_codon:yes stop_codon:yes gene_type:complete
MARFSASGTDYGSLVLDPRRLSDKQLTQALDNLGKEEKRKRIKESGKRSDVQKLLSAAGRAGLAYATGGASEALGFGGAVDNVLLGTDSEGNPVRNEYGELVGAGSAIYGAMDQKKSADIAKQALLNRQQFQDRLNYADKVGGEEGAFLRAEAMDLRDRQDAQIKSAKAKNVFEFDNTFDDLGLSGTQKLAYKKRQEELAKNEQAMSDREMAQGASIGRLTDYNASKDAEKQKVLDEIVKANAQRAVDEMSQAPTTKEIMEKYEKDRKQSLFDTRAEGGMDNLADYREANRDKIRKERKEIDQMIKERSTSIGEAEGRQAYNPNREAIAKTFSEKEAEKLSSKDTDRLRAGSMDDIAIDTKGRELGKRYSGLEGKAFRLKDEIFSPEDVQLYDEYAIGKKGEAERIKRILNDKGPMAGELQQRESRKMPVSDLKKRILNSQALDRMGERQFADLIRNISRGGINVI